MAPARCEGHTGNVHGGSVLLVALALLVVVSVAMYVVRRRFPLHYRRRQRRYRRVLGYVVLPVLLWGAWTLAVTGSLSKAGLAALGGATGAWLTAVLVRHMPTGLRRRSLLRSQWAARSLAVPEPQAVPLDAGTGEHWRVRRF